MNELELRNIIKTLETLGIIETGATGEDEIIQVINLYNIIVKVDYGKEAKEALSKALAKTYNNCSASEYCEMIEYNKLYNDRFIFYIKNRKLYTEFDETQKNNSIKIILYNKLTVIYRQKGLID